MLPLLIEALYEHSPLYFLGGDANLMCQQLLPGFGIPGLTDDTNCRDMMFVLIQNTKTREYYKDAEAWTADVHAAKQFSSSVHALECLQQSKLEGVHLVMKMGKPEFDVQLKVGSEKRDAAL